MSDGEKLKSIREELRLTQHDMAAALRISQQAISHLEGGRNRDMSMSILRQLVKRYNVNPYYLVGNSKEPMFAKPENLLRKKLLGYEELIDRLVALKSK